MENGANYLVSNAEEGHLDVVKDLLLNQADINATRKSLAGEDTGLTALHVASKNGHYNIVECLLREGANIQAIDQANMSALHHASKNGHQEIVKLLLKHKANANAIDAMKTTPLLYAVLGKYHKIVKLLVDHDPHIVEKDSITLLQEATKVNCPETIELLLSSGLLHDNSDSLSYSIHVALREGFVKNVQVLLAFYGSSIQERYGWDVLHEAAWYGNEDKVRDLLDNGHKVDGKEKGGYRAIHLASMQGHIKVVKLLIERKAHVDYSPKLGCTPLCFAAGNGHLEIVKLLLEQKTAVNINKQDEFVGETALHRASENGHLKIVQCLLENGANINILDKYGGCSSLQKAANAGKLEVVKRLLEGNAEFKMKNKLNMTPFWDAVEEGHDKIVELLGKNGGIDYCTETNIYGSSPLHIAALFGHTEVARVLLELGHPIDVQDENGQTVLHIAVEEGNLNMVNVLVTKGASLDVRDNNNHTAVEIADLLGRSATFRMWLQPNLPPIPPNANHGKVCRVTQTLSTAKQSSGHCYIVNGRLKTDVLDIEVKVKLKKKVDWSSVQHEDLIMRKLQSNPTSGKWFIVSYGITKGWEIDEQQIALISDCKEDLTDYCGVVMEKADKTLEEYFHEHQEDLKQNTLKVSALLTEFAQIVAAAHNVNVVLMDFKPDNLMLKGAQWKAIDFDCSKIVGKAIDKTITPDFASFEVAKYIAEVKKGGDIAIAPHATKSMDICSLGWIAWKLLNSYESLWDKLGLTGQQDAILSKLCALTDAEIESYINTTFSYRTALVKCVQHSLKVNPVERFNVQQFLNELKKLLTPTVTVKGLSNEIILQGFRNVEDAVGSLRKDVAQKQNTEIATKTNQVNIDQIFNKMQLLGKDVGEVSLIVASVLREAKDQKEALHNLDVALENMNINLSSQLSALSGRISSEFKNLNMSIHKQFTELEKLERLLEAQRKVSSERDIDMNEFAERIKNLLSVELQTALLEPLTNLMNNHAAEATDKQSQQALTLDLLTETVKGMRESVSDRIDELSKRLDEHYDTFDQSMKDTYKVLASEGKQEVFHMLSKLLEEQRNALDSKESASAVVASINMDELVQKMKLVSVDLKDSFLSSIADILRGSDDQQNALNKVMRKLEQMDEKITCRLNQISTNLSTMNVSIDEKLNTLNRLDDIFENQKELAASNKMIVSEVIAQMQEVLGEEFKESIISSVKAIMEDESHGQTERINTVMNMMKTLQEELFTRIDSLSADTKANFAQFDTVMREEYMKSMQRGQNEVLETLLKLLQAQSVASEKSVDNLRSTFEAFANASTIKEAAKAEKLRGMYGNIEKILFAAEEQKALKYDEKLQLLLSNMEDMKLKVNELRQLSFSALATLSKLDAKDNFMPHLFCILPDTIEREKLSTESKRIDKLKNCVSRTYENMVKALWEKSRLFFICPVTLQMVPGGPKDANGKRNGYLISIPSKLLQQTVKVVKIGLLVLQIALASQGMGNVISPLAQSVTQFFPSLNLTEVEQLISQLPMHELKEGIKQLQSGDSNIHAMKCIYKLIANAEGQQIDLTHQIISWKPQETGLNLVQSELHGESAWVSDDAILEFKAEGVRCFREMEHQKAQTVVVTADEEMKKVVESIGIDAKGESNGQSGSLTDDGASIKQ